MTETTLGPLGNVITIDDERVKRTSTAWFGGSVEEKFNALLMPRRIGCRCAAP